MKRILLLPALFFILFQILKAEDWKALNDSTEYWFEIGNFEKAQQFAKQLYDLSQKNYTVIDTQYEKSIYWLVNTKILNDDTLNIYELAKQDSILRQNLYGEKSREFAICLLNISNVNSKNKKFMEAEKYINDAIDIFKLNNDTLSKEYFDLIVNKCDNYYNTNRLSEEESLYLKSIKFIENNSAYNNPKYSTMLIELGYFYFLKDNFNKAEELFFKAKQNLELNNKTNYDNYEIVNYFLGRTFEDVYNFKSAESYYLKSCELKGKMFGFDSYFYSLRINDLGLFYHELGEFNKADSIFQLSLSIKEKKGKVDGTYIATLNNLARTKTKLGDYKNAEKILFLCDSISRNLNKQENSQFYANIANLYLQNQQYEKCEIYYRLYEKKIKEKYGVLSLEYATSINLLGLACSKMEKFAEAEHLLTQSVDIVKNNFGEDTYNYDVFIANLADLYYKLDKYDESVRLYKQAIDIETKRYGDNNTHLITTFNNFAFVYEDMDKYREAEDLFKKSIKIIEKSFGKNHPNYYSMRGNLGALYRDIGKYKDAELLLRDELEFNRNFYGIESRQYANSLEAMADLNSDIGKIDSLEYYYLTALNIIKKFMGENNNAFSGKLNSLAIYYSNIGDYIKSENMNKKAIQINKNIFGENNSVYASSLGNLASLYNEMGRFNESEKLRKQDIEISRNVFGEKNSSYAIGLNNLAFLYSNTNRSDSAIILVKKAIEIFHDVYGENSLKYMVSLNNLGVFYSELGYYDDALSAHKKNLALRIKNLGAEHYYVAFSYNNLGYTYLLLGKYDEALENVTKAKKIILNTLGDKSKLFFTSLSVTAKSNRFLGNINESLRSYDELIQSSVSLAYINFPFLNEKARSEFWKNSQLYFDNYYSLITDYYEKKPELAFSMYDKCLISKGLILNTVKNQYVVSRASDKSKLARAKYAHYVSNPNQAKALGINIDSLLTEAEQAESDYTIKQTKIKIVDTVSYTWKDIQKKLKNEEAAIEIIRYQYYDNRKAIKTCYAALILKPENLNIKKDNNDIDIVIFDNGNELEEKIIKRYTSISSSLAKDNLNPMLADELGKIYNQFWKKINDKLTGIKKVYFSPDGVYNQLNLNTLVNPATGKYLIDEIDINVIPSTRDLVSKQDSRGSNIEFNSSTKTAELFGNPKYFLDSLEHAKAVSRYKQSNLIDLQTRGQILSSIESGKTQSQNNVIRQLPGTRKEIENIADILKKNQWKTNVYLGSDAIEEAVKNIQSPFVLHIATHGKFQQDVETADNSSFGMDTRQFKGNPLFRSMLLMAGAENSMRQSNQSDLLNSEQASYDDGILSAFEVVNLNLDNTELVVLSACETGLGEIKNGEGVYGLQRAFFVAGAKSLIMSLWNVSDIATQNLMISFYEKWLSGKSKRQAFREAQQDLRKKFPGYFFWGAFVMVGE